jgi:tripartite-type tricarboxylate transporter receptor subunit TctC
MLATFNPTRIPGYPAVPTVRELGYNVVVQKFRGLAGPKGLPPAIIKTWEAATQKVLADPEFKKSYAEENLVPNFMAHEQYGPFITKFAADSTNFLKTTGVIH